MVISGPTGSAALDKRLVAFGGVVTALAGIGIAPVTAVVLALLASVVLSKI